jgi:hypothetical protein
MKLARSLQSPHILADRISQSQCGVDGMQTMRKILALRRRCPCVQYSRQRDIHTTLYERIAALYDQVAPSEAALVLTTIMELLYAGRPVFLGPVSEAEV